MRKKLIIIALLINLAFGAYLLSSNQRLYSKSESDKFGFEVSENSVLQNPPAGKARIYALRTKEYIGASVSYELYYQYNPTISVNIKGQSEPLIDKNAYERNVVGKFSNESKFFKDFDAGKALLLLSTLETHSYIVFTPKAGRIYCVKGSIILGLNKARPNLEFIGKDECETLYKKIQSH